MPPRKSNLWHRVFLGPLSSYRNGHRTWTYLAFVLAVVIILLVATLKQGG